ncbi:TPA: lysozyme [Serratia fonticola]
MSKKQLAGCSVTAIIALVLALFLGEIRTGEAGLSLIGNAEGCIRDPYHCPAGVLTVGVGSTGNVNPEKRYSDEEIARRWLDDIKTAESCVNSRFNGRDMPQPTFEAMTSLAFNLGCAGIRWNSKAKRPTQIYQYAQAKNWPAMCQRIPDFSYSGGKRLRGLEIRRNTEMTHCLSGASS